MAENYYCCRSVVLYVAHTEAGNCAQTQAFTSSNEKIICPESMPYRRAYTVTIGWLVATTDADSKKRRKTQSKPE